ncbi:hypothetical protein TRVL_09357 [Trypanosoma vivax]|nr:hypothetical protein TRVL_09357 [Trypanosoma vivax]
MWSVLMRHELYRRHQPCERTVASAGLPGQRSAGRKPHREAGDNFSSAVRGVEGDTCRCGRLRSRWRLGKGLSLRTAACLAAAGMLQRDGGTTLGSASSHFTTCSHQR